MKHGLTGTPTFNSWANMVQRCTNHQHPSWDRYGGRGIRICDEWLSFENFLRDMGQSGGLTIERIDNDGNYEPSNCVWATRSEQSANKSNSRYVDFEGERMPISRAIAASGLSTFVVYKRIRDGIPEGQWFAPPLSIDGYGTKPKLSWPIVDAIRASTESHTALARRYGVCRQLISAVKSGERWKECDRPSQSR